MGLLFIYLFISVFFSFLCSILEAVLLSITPSFASIAIKEKKKYAAKLKEFKDDIDEPLAAILTLNTFAHTIGAAGVGAQASSLIKEHGLPGFDKWGLSLDAEGFWGGITAFVLTLIILFFSEIIPKTIGANSWKALTPFTVNTISIVKKIMYPFVLVTKLITKVLKKDKEKSVLSRADLSAMADMTAESDEFNNDETKILQNLLKFNTVLTHDIMTPRTVVISADGDMTIQEFYDKHKNLRFSRIPIYTESIDKTNRFFLKDDMLDSIIKGFKDVPLRDISREIIIVNEDLPIPTLFNQLMEEREHIALVVDKFGGMAGIVTMEDVIETLLGMEILDEFDNIEDMQGLARKQWESRAKRLGLIIDDADNVSSDTNESTEG